MFFSSDPSIIGTFFKNLFTIADMQAFDGPCEPHGSSNMYRPDKVTN